MSDFQRSFLKAKLANLPLEPPMPRNAPPPHLSMFDEAEEDAALGYDAFRGEVPSSPINDDSSSASSASSTSTIRPGLFTRPELCVPP